MQLASHGSVVIAEQQTAGRGRRGKRWHSPQSDNIYCSLGVKKKFQPSHLGLISILVGVSIARVLSAQGYSEIGLKWPNDILLKGKKLGGILIETQALGEDMFYLVIGFGLNMTLDPSALIHIDQPAIGLTQVDSCCVNRQVLLSSLISGILGSLKNFEIEASTLLLDEFSHFDEFRGKQVQVITQAGILNGVYLGLESTGQLKVRTDQGIMSFAAAEISLRKVSNVID
jgi:BirA family biotin operon repressor/biotin-[acetyl-CoA-carboxylase] ligase